MFVKWHVNPTSLAEVQQQFNKVKNALNRRYHKNTGRSHTGITGKAQAELLLLRTSVLHLLQRHKPAPEKWTMLHAVDLLPFKHTFPNWLYIAKCHSSSADILYPLKPQLSEVYKVNRIIWLTSCLLIQRAVHYSDCWNRWKHLLYSKLHSHHTDETSTLCITF